MASAGDTITYTYSGSRVTEDISSIETFEVLYCEAGTDEFGEQRGGRVENVVVDVASHNDLYIWVGEEGQAGNAFGRYEGSDALYEPGGAGSSEVSLEPTEQGDSPTEPFIVAAGGAGGGIIDGFVTVKGVGARNSSGNGEPPPQGGDPGEDGDGAVDGHGTTATIKQSGTTITGGGPTDGNGEIKISYQGGLSPPTNVAITDDSTVGELTLDWDPVSNANGYYVYRAQASGSTTGDYTEVADVSSPPYTDSDLEDGEQYYYRVASHV